MSQAATTSSGGIGIGGLLTIVFVLLKAFGKISWPWIWVFAPLWISAALGAAFVLLIFAFAIVMALIS